MKITPLFDAEYFRNGTRYGHSYNGLLTRALLSLVGLKLVKILHLKILVHANLPPFSNSGFGFQEIHESDIDYR